MLEYYVPKVNFKGELEMWNIFDNCYVSHYCLKEVKKYLRAPSKYKATSYTYTNEKKVSTGIDGLCEEFDKIFMHEFWSRYEYEFSISKPFPVDENGQLKEEFCKKDIYWLLQPNIRSIVYDVIRQYKAELKA